MTTLTQTSARERLTKLNAVRDRLIDGETEVQVRYGDWAATYSAGNPDSMAALQAEIDRMRRFLKIGGRRSVTLGFR